MLAFASLILADVRLSEQRSFELARLPHGWWAVLALALFVALCAFVIGLYRRESRVGASRRLRLVLATLRCVVLVILAAVWLQPVIATYVVRTAPARIAVLVDASASMAIADPAGMPDTAERTRFDRVRDLLAAGESHWLRRLAERNELAVYAFGEFPSRLDEPRPDDPTAETTDVPAAETALPARRAARRLGEPLPAGIQNRTDLGAALALAIEQSGSGPIAGLIVFTDGGANKGMSADELTAYAARFKVRVFAVGIGAATEPPNVRVAELMAPTAPPKDDPFEIRVQLAASGVEPTPVQLELLVRKVGDASEPRVVESRSVTLGGENSSAVELFRIQPREVGEFSYEARLARLPGEALETDNSREATVRIVDEKLRVLVVAGRPSYDFRFATTLLERDKSIDLSVWLQSADAQAVRDGDIVITELPRKPEELFAYDALLLLDPNPADLDSAWAVSVRRLVDEFGGGLLVQAGPHFTSRFLRDARLQDLVACLPIVPDPDADVRLSDEGTYRMQAAPLDAPADVADHPLLALLPDSAASRRLWSILPGVYWHLPVLREKPLATVLLRLGQTPDRTRGAGAVLFAVQPFGAGRAAFLGFDGTWRWRANAQRQFNRFWVQLTRYLAQARQSAGGKRGVITLDRDAVNLGDTVKIEARVLDEQFVPWHEPTLEGEIEYADGTHRPLTLAAIPGREGWFAGRALGEREGAAVVRVARPGAATAAAAERFLTRSLRIYRPEIELRTLRLQAEPLQQLAQAVPDGRFLPFADAATLPDEIERAAEVTVTRGRNRELWDTAALLLVVATLLGVEWFLRRRSQLL